MLTFTSEIRDFGGAGTWVMAIRHGNTTIKWSVGSASSGFAGRYSSTFGLQTFTSRITGNAAARHIRQVSQMMVSQLRASRRQLSSPPLQECTGSHYGPRACSAGFQPACRMHLSNNAAEAAAKLEDHHIAFPS